MIPNPYDRCLKVNEHHKNYSAVRQEVFALCGGDK
jgi:hypothetical protein